MQERHTNRQVYFRELAKTSEKYYLPYVRQFVPLGREHRVLEVGCGEGGNLYPFAQLGCSCLGIDLSEQRIKDAELFFAQDNISNISFSSCDFLSLPIPEEKFDLVLLHDVIEHIEPPHKKEFFNHLLQWLKPSGILFVGFPAWQMPFGGHQQICHSKLLSKTPFIHLLPSILYRALLRIGGENMDCINELLSIKRARTTIECFESIVREEEGVVQNRILWFINPHYEVKFGLKPQKLHSIVGQIPILRNFFTTSCFYIITAKDGYEKS